MTGSVLIVGASRGIGLRFAETYAADGWEVHATTRTPHDPGVLGDIAGNVSIHGLEVRDLEQIGALADVFDGRGLDVLIHSAGVLRGVSREEMRAINADAPLDVVDSLMPAMLRGQFRKIAILTSKMGSRNGARTPLADYGASKCLLNDRFRDLEPHWRILGIRAVVFHPGWVSSDMGGAGAPVSVNESVGGMRRVIDDLGPRSSGKFFTWKGIEHPW
jgi:NAD(P)-dependent dehydrogenase (short-subunit alcohol dehydrogenase family)